MGCDEFCLKRATKDALCRDGERVPLFLSFGVCLGEGVVEPGLMDGLPEPVTPGWG